MSELTENSHLQSNIKMPVIRGRNRTDSNYTDQQSGSSTYALFWVGFLQYPVCRMRFHWCFQRFLLEPGPIFFRDF